MTPPQSLDSEFARLEGEAPAVDEVRGALAVRLEQHEKRRRTGSLVAVAASVVLVAGGVGLGAALLSSQPDTARPAAAPAVVAVPEVPLAPDTQLVRHRLQPVTSPVAAEPPEGLTGQSWWQMPGRLAVVWFDPAERGGAGADRYLAGSVDATISRTAGYVITDQADDPVRVPGPEQGAAEVASRELTIAGHTATVQTAPAGALDSMGFPAEERVSWQLPDGRYIHLWVDGMPTRDSSPSSALVAFAESVRPEATALPRAIGIGLTLPGFTQDSSMNANPTASVVAEILWLCQPGTDPMATDAGSSHAGSSTASAPQQSDMTSSAPSATLAGAGGTPAEGSVPPRAAEPAVQQPCVTIGVMAGDAYAPGTLDRGSVTTVAGSQVRTQPEEAIATAELRDGLVAVVSAPSSAGLSAEDLAALAASVRISPDVTVLSPPTSMAGSAGAEVSGSPITTASSAALPGGPIQMPIIVLRDSEHPVALRPAGDLPGGPRLGTIEFSVRNVTTQPAMIDAISLGSVTVTSGGPFVVSDPASAVTLAGVEGRLDNLPSDADTDLVPVTAPMLLAPGSTVRLALRFEIGDCDGLPRVLPQLDLHYSTVEVPASGPGGASSSSSWGGFALPDALGLPDWSTALAAPLCPAP